MKNFFAWAAPLVVVLALLGAVVAMCSCYDPNNPPPCRPGSVDYPRCNPTDPPFRTRITDGGAPG